MRVLMIGAAALCVAGCQTQDGDWSKDVRVSQYSADTAMITVRGNGFASDQGVQVSAMRAAARRTLAGGFNCFIVTGSQDRSGTSQIVTPGTATTTTTGSVYGTGYGAYGTAQSYTTYNPGQVYDVYKPGIGMQIEMYAAPPQGSRCFKAEEVLAYTAPKAR